MNIIEKSLTPGDMIGLALDKNKMLVTVSAGIKKRQPKRIGRRARKGAGISLKIILTRQRVNALLREVNAHLDS